MLKVATREACTPAPSKAPAPSITDLYRKFETLHEKLRAAEKQLDASNINDASSPAVAQFERLAGRCRKLASQIVATPATSISEILLRLRVVAWGHLDSDYDKLEDLDHMMPAAIEEGEAARVLGSIQADLLRLTRAH